MRTLVCAALVGLAFIASGCAAGRLEDGREVVGFLSPFAHEAGGDAGAGAVAAGGAVGSAVGGTIFGPAGALIGDNAGQLIVAAVLGLFGYSQGRHRGWDERDHSGAPGGHDGRGGSRERRE